MRWLYVEIRPINPYTRVFEGGLFTQSMRSIYGSSNCTVLFDGEQLKIWTTSKGGFPRFFVREDLLPTDFFKEVFR